MSDITTYSEPTVTKVRSSGGDISVVQAARVSVVGENPIPDHLLLEENEAKLINYLVRKKHGSPFEHNSMTFYVKAPIFVFREFHRHRIGFSYNEMSGRYTELPGEFYIPAEERPLINTGSSANPKFEAGEPELYAYLQAELMDAYEEDWDRYQRLLAADIGKEVARIVLPVGIMSQMYVTCNARSLMSFLALRTSDERASFPSNPQYEIEQVARKVEAFFAEMFPETYASWIKNGRVAP